MQKRITPLSDVKVKTAKPAERPTKIFDGLGLFLLVTPTGGKLWHFKYLFEGKEKLLTLGAYPEISLAEARRKRDEARKKLASGIDPSAVKQAQKTAQTRETETLKVIAREWLARFAANWVPETAAKNLSHLLPHS